MSQPKFLLGHTDSALTDINWILQYPTLRTHRISESELEPLIRLAFLLLPKIVIQDSSVANNILFADLYQKHGASFLSVLRSSTEIVTSYGQKSFADLRDILRERQAYGVPQEGEEGLRYERWITTLDQHGVSNSFRHYDLSQLSVSVQSHVFSPDRLERVGLGRTAAKLSALESTRGPLAGHANRTWYFQLARDWQRLTVA